MDIMVKPNILLKISILNVYCPESDEMPKNSTMTHILLNQTEWMDGRKGGMSKIGNKILNMRKEKVNKFTTVFISVDVLC